MKVLFLLLLTLTGFAESFKGQDPIKPVDTPCTYILEGNPAIGRNNLGQSLRGWKSPI